MGRPAAPRRARWAGAQTAELVGGRAPEPRRAQEAAGHRQVAAAPAARCPTTSTCRLERQTRPAAPRCRPPGPRACRPRRQRRPSGREPGHAAGDLERTGVAVLPASRFANLNDRGSAGPAPGTPSGPRRVGPRPGSRRAAPQPCTSEAATSGEGGPCGSHTAGAARPVLVGTGRGEKDPIPGRQHGVGGRSGEKRGTRSGPPGASPRGRRWDRRRHARWRSPPSRPAPPGAGSTAGARAPAGRGARRDRRNPARTRPR